MSNGLRNNRIKSIPLAAAFCAACFLFSGCTLLDRLKPEDVPVSAPTPQPIIETPAPSPTPFFVNPVHSFYETFINECGFNRFRDMLSSESSLHALELLMDFSSHMGTLDDIKATVCRLFEDGESYSGSVSGSASGSGQMTALSENFGYRFTFTFDDKSYIEGTYTTDMMLGFSCYAAEDGGESFVRKYVCSITKTPDGWRSTVNEGGSISTFILSADSSSFSSSGYEACLKDGIIDIYLIKE